MLKVTENIRVVTYEPSSHSGSTRLPPPLTAGIQDFLGGRAATTSNLLEEEEEEEDPTLAATGEDNKAWLFLPPVKKEEPKPLRIAAEVAAISFPFITSLYPSLFLMMKTKMFCVF